MFQRRNREFQAGLNPTEARRRREKNSLSLRRKERENKLQNKRKKILTHMRHQRQTPDSNTPNQEELLRDLPRFIQGIQTNHKGAILECVRNIRTLLSSSASAVPIKQVMDTGIVPRIITFLQMKDCPQIQFEAMWVLTNISSSDIPEYTASVVRHGALPSLLAILKTSNYPLQEQAIWTLGNIAGESVPLRDQILQPRVLQTIFDVCRTPLNPNSFCRSIGAPTVQDQYCALLDTLSWCLSNLGRGRGHTRDQVFTLVKCARFIIEYKKTIRGEMQQKVHSIDQNLAWTCFYLTEGSHDPSIEEAMLDCLFEFGIVAELIRLLGTKAMRSCLKTIGNILAGQECYTQKCIDLGVIRAIKLVFRKLLSQSKKDYTYLKELCWSTSNITAGPPEHVALVQELELFPVVVHLLQTGPYVTAKEAMWAVANAMTSGDAGIVYYLCTECKLIAALCRFNKLFISHSYSRSMEKALMVSLETITGILSAQQLMNTTEFSREFEVNGGCDFLEHLQAEDKVSQEVYDAAVGIIKDWFPEEGVCVEGGAGDGAQDNIDISYCGDNVFGNNQFGFGFNTNNDGNRNNNNNNGNNENANRFQF